MRPSQPPPAAPAAQVAPGRTRLSVVTAVQPGEVSEARGLFEAYAQSLNVSLCFQGFDEELAGLPGDYAAPRGRLLLGLVDGQARGCAALRPLEPGVCEMKRLYVRPEARGTGLGELLARRIIAEAAALGYARMRLDTLPQMEAAQALYRRLGFRPIGNYNGNPIPGAVFFELDLGAGVHPA
jgi:putative acetyltransferase